MDQTFVGDQNIKLQVLKAALLLFNGLGLTRRVGDCSTLQLHSVVRKVGDRLLEGRNRRHVEALSVALSDHHSLLQSNQIKICVKFLVIFAIQIRKQIQSHQSCAFHDVKIFSRRRSFG